MDPPRRPPSSSTETVQRAFAYIKLTLTHESPPDQGKKALSVAPRSIRICGVRRRSAGLGEPAPGIVLATSLETVADRVAAVAAGADPPKRRACRSSERLRGRRGGALSGLAAQGQTAVRRAAHGRPRRHPGSRLHGLAVA